MVYYDDLFDIDFGKNAEAKIQAIIATADLMLLEKKKLGTSFEINIKNIQHAKESKWEANEWKLPNECLLDCFSTGHCIQCKNCHENLQASGDPQSCASTEFCAKCEECVGSCPRELGPDRYVKRYSNVLFSSY